MIMDSTNDQQTLICTALVHGITPDLADALDLLKPEYFSDFLLKKTFEAISLMRQHNLVVNLINVADRVNLIDSFQALDALCQNTLPTAQPMAHAQQIIRFHRTFTVSQELAKMSLDLASDPINAKRIGSRLMDLAGDLDFASAHKDPRSLKDLADDYLQGMDDRLSGKAPASIGLDIGLDVDINFNDLVVIGGTPGMGKTALLLYILDYVAANGKDTLLFSLEMGEQQIVERQISLGANVPVRWLKRPMEVQDQDGFWTSVSAAVSRFQGKTVHVDDTARLTLAGLRTRIRRWLSHNPDTGCIGIDYLTLLEMPKGDNQTLRVAEVTRSLKLLAKEIRVPIILLSQQNRDAPKDKREPEISDLRDSGAVEQDADKILFPYREEVFFGDDTPNAGVAKILKRKVRDGQPGYALLRFSNGNFYPAHENDEWQTRETKRSGRFTG